MRAPTLLLLASLGVAPPAAAQDLRLVPALGAAWLEQGRAGQRGEATGVALELHLDGRAEASRVGYGVTFTWGLTDWDRAREYVDAGNRAGRWTTDRFADVEAWVRRGEDVKGKDTRALRFLGAVFADLFLALTYAAVPVCYAGSVAGATSHLQLDFTGSVHLAEGRHDAWLELGAGAATLPVRLEEWTRALGPVAGFGARFGIVRLGARALWSPAPLNTARHHGKVLASAATLGIAL